VFISICRRLILAIQPALLSERTVSNRRRIKCDFTIFLVTITRKFIPLLFSIFLPVASARVCASLILIS